MTTEQMIKMALSYKGISQAQLARELQTSPSNLNQKLKRDSFAREDLEAIAAILGAEFICSFRFPDGTTI